LASLLEAAGQRALLERGLVLAVPDSAVIDTGSLKIVYDLLLLGTFRKVRPPEESALMVDGYSTKVKP